MNESLLLAYSYFNIGVLNACDPTLSFLVSATEASDVEKNGLSAMYKVTRHYGLDKMEIF